MQRQKRWVLLVVLISCALAESGCTKKRKIDLSRKPRVTRVSGSGTSALGTNLDGVRDFSPELGFVDAFKRSREFISGSEGTWDDKRPFELDKNGYVKTLEPGRVARALVIWDLKRYPKGAYTLLWQGSGTVKSWPQQAAQPPEPTQEVAEQAQHGKQHAGRVVINADPAEGGLGFLISDLKPTGDHVRDIHLIMPGGSCEHDPLSYCDDQTPCAKSATCIPFTESYSDQPFHPRFLQSIKPYGTIRFMDWMNTNEGLDKEWKDRPKPEDAHWTRGVPVEIMVKLANLMNQDPWFTLSHQATDGYVREFAGYVKQHLKPNLKAYVEYSNEVWNTQFPQAKYATQQGQAQQLGENPWEARTKFYAQRARQIHRIWSEVFGNPKRLVRVLGAHAGNINVAEVALSFEDAYQDVDALAIAPYFGGSYGEPENASDWAGMPVETFMQHLQTKGLEQVEQFMKQHAALARQYGVDLIAYEGGQHLVGVRGTENNQKLSQLFDQANRHPKMKDIYLDYLARWKNAGGGLFVHFTSCSPFNKWGRWGAAEYLGQPRSEAPKLDALLTFTETTPKWW